MKGVEFMGRLPRLDGRSLQLMSTSTVMVLGLQVQLNKYNIKKFSGQAYLLYRNILWKKIGRPKMNRLRIEWVSLSYATVCAIHCCLQQQYVCVLRLRFSQQTIKKDLSVKHQYRTQSLRLLMNPNLFGKNIEIIYQLPQLR